MKYHKCAYNKCLHESKNITGEEIKCNGKYYHVDCFDKKNQLARIRNYYFDNIDSKADFMEVCLVLNNMVLKQGVDGDFLEYALECLVEKKYINY